MILEEALGFQDLEFLVPYICTLILIVAKLSFGLYLRTRYKKSEQKNYFVKGASTLMLFLAASRIFYFIFDYYLTRLNPDLYWISPNVWFWKAGNLLSGAGVAYLLYVIDKKIYNFRFKGFFTYASLVVAFVQFFWPVNDANSFSQASTIGVFSIGFGLLLPLTFLYVGVKSSGELRTTAFLMTLGITLYALVSQLLNESFLDIIGADKGTPVRVFIFAFVPLFKILALALVTYCSTKFRL